jgi:DNA-directed RNA polymerase specialized sigma subunit
MKNKKENNFPIKESEAAGLNDRVNKLAIKSGISLTPEQQKLIEDNIGWLEGVVRDELKKLRGRFTYHTYNDLLSDLLQEGAIGLIKAALNFDPNANTLFRTYAERRVRGAVLDYLRRIDPLGRDSRKLIKSIKDIKDNFYRKFGRLPTDEEVAKELGISPEVYKKRYKNMIPPKFVDIDDVDIQSHIINFENFLNETLDRDKKSISLRKF